MNPSMIPQSKPIRRLRALTLTVLASVFAFSACAGVSPATTPPATTAAQTDTWTLEGLILTNGTVYITKSPAVLQLNHQPAVIHRPDSVTLTPGALVEFVIAGAIAESWPVQARALSYRVISETSPVIATPIDNGSALLGHLMQGARLIDVRTKEEFAEGHLPDAVNIPVDQITAELPKIAATNETLLIYCRSGNRSATAASALKQLGFKVVLDLGGIIDYTGELVKGDQ